jgi:RNA polymerase sigma-70 factor (ECF subfamily)
MTAEVQLPWSKKTKRFEEAVLPYLPDVYRLARQMSDEHRAPDLVQETFLRAWKYFHSFEEGTNGRAWLFRILHNVCADQWRRTRLEVQSPSVEELESEPQYDLEEVFTDDGLSPEVERALSELAAPYRWAVLLADVEELTYQEIARVMDCPVGTVMSRISRGRRTLARLLRSYRAERGREAETFLGGVK